MIADRVLGLRRAEAAARAMNRRHGVRSPADIRIEVFAAARGISIVEGGVVGALARLCWGSRPTIRVAEHVTDPAEQRWSFGHELGHHVLEHPGDDIDTLCNRDRTYRPAQSGHRRHFEAEANVFAAELLMPYEQLAARCDRAAPSLEIAYAIAKRFTTPIAACAIRFVEITTQPCCVVYSERNRVAWSVASLAFGAKIPRGTIVGPGAVAFQHAERVTIDDRAQPVAASAWLPTRRNVELIEHSAALPGASGVLTLLSIPESVIAPSGGTVPGHEMRTLRLGYGNTVTN